MMYKTVQLMLEPMNKQNYNMLDCETLQTKSYGKSLIKIIADLNKEGYFLSAVEGQGDNAKYYFTKIVSE